MPCGCPGWMVRTTCKSTGKPPRNPRCTIVQLPQEQRNLPVTPEPACLCGTSRAVESKKLQTSPHNSNNSNSGRRSAWFVAPSTKGKPQSPPPCTEMMQQPADDKTAGRTLAKDQSGRTLECRNFFFDLIRGVEQGEQ